MLLIGICSVQERSQQVCLDRPHLHNVGSSSFLYSSISVTGTAPHAVETIIGIYIYIWYLAPLFLPWRPWQSLIWTLWFDQNVKFNYQFPKCTNNATIFKPTHLNLMRINKFAVSSWGNQWVVKAFWKIRTDTCQTWASILTQLKTVLNFPSSWRAQSNSPWKRRVPHRRSFAGPL